MQVSIVIPTYNRAKLVCEAVVSALVEIGEGLGEVIVVDDGSTDDTKARLAAHGDAIRYVAIANRGVSAARNVGLSLASGLYIRFLDSDDLIVAGSTRHLLRGFERSDADAIIGLRADANANDYPIPETGIDAVDRSNWIKPEQLLWHGVQVGTAMFRKDRLVEIGGFDEHSSFGEDYDLIFRGLAAGWRTLLVPEPACQVRNVAAERISARPAAHQYLYLSEMMGKVANRLALRLDRDENARRVFGRWIWYMGRVAAREGFRTESQRFFSLARRIAGPAAVSGHPLIRSSYTVCPPYYVERVAEKLKAILRLAGRGKAKTSR